MAIDSPPPAPAPPSIPPIAPEQLAYAGVLDWGMKFGLAVLVVTFGVYSLNLCAPHVPIDKLPECWKLPADEFMKQVGISRGWGWTKKVLHGDYLNLIGVVVLASATVFCYLRILPILWRKGDFIYVAIAMVEILIMVLAGSGILSASHH